MVKINLYAIRHKPTGGYLPAPQGRGGRGGSHMEPMAFTGNQGKHGVIPRVWATERAAKAALWHWLQGKYVAYRYGDYEDFEEEIEIVPQPHRKEGDMEIVPVTVELQ